MVTPPVLQADADNVHHLSAEVALLCHTRPSIPAVSLGTSILPQAVADGPCSADFRSAPDRVVRRIYRSQRRTQGHIGCVVSIRDRRVNGEDNHGIGEEGSR